MCVDSLTKWTDFRARGRCDLSSDCHSSGTAYAGGRWSREQRWQRRQRRQRWQGKPSAPRMRVLDLRAQSTRTRTALKLTRRAASAVRSVTLRPRVAPLGRRGSPKGTGREPRNCKGGNGPSTSCWNCDEPGHGGALCPKKKCHTVAEQTPASQDRQDATVGAIGRHFDF